MSQGRQCSHGGDTENGLQGVKHKLCVNPAVWKWALGAQGGSRRPVTG